MTQIEFFDGSKRKYNIMLPSCWDEMTADQVRFVFREYDKVVSGKLSPLQLEVLLVFRLLGLRRISTKSAFNEAVTSNIAQICKTIDYIFLSSENGALPQLSFCSVQNPLPAVRTKARVLTGPATLCQDLTFGEYRQASVALNAFFQSSDIRDLDECIAHLYRPQSAVANKAGRKVRPVLPETFESEVKAVSGIPGWQKNIIMMWFASCINYLQTGTLTLGGEEVDMSRLFSSSDGSGQPSTWNDLLIQLAREGTIGNIEAVDEAPLMVVLLHMWSNYKENKRHEKAAKARKTRKA